MMELIYLSEPKSINLGQCGYKVMVNFLGQVTAHVWFEVVLKRERINSMWKKLISDERLLLVHLWGVQSYMEKNIYI